MAMSLTQECLSQKGTAEDSISINESPGYVEPSLQDLLLLDVKHDTLVEIGENMEIQYLGENDEKPLFPVTGLLFMPNVRLMVNLICSRHKRSGKHGPQLNIIFLVDTGSPVTYLSQQAMHALIGADGTNAPKSMKVKIHDGTVVICHISPQDKHFADVNVLGMDYLSIRQLSMNIDYKQNTVVMLPSEMEGAIQIARPGAA